MSQRSSDITILALPSRPTISSITIATPSHLQITTSFAITPPARLMAIWRTFKGPLCLLSTLTGQSYACLIGTGMKSLRSGIRIRVVWGQKEWDICGIRIVAWAGFARRILFSLMAIVWRYAHLLTCIRSAKTTLIAACSTARLTLTKTI